MPDLSASVKLPPAAIPVPNPGDVNGQLSQASSLASQISSVAGGGGDPSKLIAAGVTILAGIGGGAGGAIAQISRVATDILGGASTGAAVGGPYGAAIGAAMGLLESLSNIGQYQGVSGDDSGPAVDEIYSRQQAWIGTTIGTGTVTGHPQGWSLCDYMAVATPPHTTRRPALLLALMQHTAPQNGLTKWLAALTEVNNLSHSGGPTALYNCVSGIWSGAGGANLFAGATEPLCTPVFWWWKQSNRIADCILSEWFGWAVPPDQQGDSGAGGSPPQLHGSLQSPGVIDLAKGDIIPPPHQTQSQVLSRALARLPDPLYISADLYAQQTQNDTWYYNTSGLVAVSTILGLLAVGASTRAIVSELLLQYKTLTSNGEQTAIVQSLIDDYISLAKYEEKHQTFPGWGAVASKFTPHVEPAGSGGTSSSVHAPTTNSAAAATVEKFLMRYLGGHR